MSERPLSKQEETQLVNVSLYGIPCQVKGSLPGLERRGLVAKYCTWSLTDAGWAEVRRIRDRAADSAPKGTAS